MTPLDRSMAGGASERESQNLGPRAEGGVDRRPVSRLTRISAASCRVRSGPRCRRAACPRGVPVISWTLQRRSQPVSPAVFHRFHGKCSRAPDAAGADARSSGCGV